MSQIEQLCQDSNLSCGRGIFIGIYAGLIFAISIYCLIKLYGFMGRISYEMIPLTTCAIQSSLHFINDLFLVTNSLQIVIIYFCLQTFILISQSFFHLYYKMTYSNEEFQGYRRKQKYSLLIFYILFTTIILVYLIQIDDQNCLAYFNVGLVLQFIIILFSVLISILYGQKLKQVMNKHEQTNVTKIANYQTTAVQIVLSTTAIFEFIMSILSLTTFQGLFCNLPLNNSNDDGFTSGENVYLTFFSIIEMTPCILVPLIFFYLPQISQQQDKKQEINLNDTFLLQSARPSLDFSGLINISIELKQ
ncbi:unnamed protein product (macronuclear) [Paramecium tetraurelia]|uniref:THH1/TOM1/TOM3 domain-containing protein n=1 Tax=Paramecium tetraurelia TaxID=5888 RepID=A0DCN0_PARTE|nr:uncharacterized protein GSPATT00015676001 [Paramecium tetraurelia]CAK80797.1 unnamed protein product [Paramecium tetraurelia]|eukprot:XP_001448194.1 hypothetical protein (macronuclear) [Paramecium tetraurelia strain d4-2]